MSWSDSVYDCFNSSRYGDRILSLVLSLHLYVFSLFLDLLSSSLLFNASFADVIVAGELL